MPTFVIAALLIYGAMHFYAFSKVWPVLPHTIWPTLTLVLLGVILSLSPLLLWQLSRHEWHDANLVASWLAYLWMGFLFLFCCIALILDACHLLFVLAGGRWPLSAPASLAGIVLLASALLLYGFFEARTIRVEEIKITSAKLPPATARISIAQISDLHLGIMLGGNFLDQVIARLRELQPDIIVATGDILDGHGDNLAPLAMQLAALQPPHGAYAVLGNHEYFAGPEKSLHFLQSAGFTVLRGEAAAAGGIVLLGEDDATAAALGGEVRDDIRHALAAVPGEKFTVLLKHQPVVEADIAVDLQLSGHIHGGQIWPFGLITRIFYPVNTGLARLDDGRLLYVSRGTGTWGPPIRLFAPPEITLITIENGAR